MKAIEFFRFFLLVPDCTKEKVFKTPSKADAALPYVASSYETQETILS